MISDHISNVASKGVANLQLPVSVINEWNTRGKCHTYENCKFATPLFATLDVWSLINIVVVKLTIQAGLRGANIYVKLIVK